MINKSDDEKKKDEEEEQEYDFGDVFQKAEEDAERSATTNRKYSKGVYADLNHSKAHRDSFFEYDATKFLGRGQTKNQAPKKILDIYPQFQTDNRAGLCAVKACMTCAFFKSREGTTKYGFCLLATKRKFAKSSNPLIVQAEGKHYLRNKLYADMNWVHAHASMYCDSYKHSNMKLSSVDSWVRKYTNTDPSLAYRNLTGTISDKKNIKFKPSREDLK